MSASRKRRPAKRAPARSSAGGKTTRGARPKAAAAPGASPVGPPGGATSDLAASAVAALQARVSDLESELAAERARAAESLSRQAATAEILRIISSSPADLEPVAQAIVDSAFRLCGCSFAAVFRFDGELIHWVAARGTSIEQEDALRRVWPRPPDRATLTGRMVLARETVHVHDIELDPDYGVATAPGVRQALAIRSFLGVPLFRDGRLIGTINLHRSEVRPFSAQEVTLVQTFADQAVIAMGNVQLFDELATRNGALTEALEQQTATSELLKVIGRSNVDLQPVFDALAESAVRLCQAQRAFIFRFDGDVLRVVAAHNVSAARRAFVEANPIRPGRHSAAARAALERRIVHIHDIQTDPEYTYGVGQSDPTPTRTVLGVPVSKAGELLGVIILFRFELLPFSAGHIALIETFADQAAIAIDNARLFNELGTRNLDLTDALDQQVATSEILRVMSASPTDVQPVFEAIAESAQRLCDGSFAGVFRFDGELMHRAASRHLTPAAAAWFEQAYPMAPSRAQISGRAVLTRVIVHVPDLLEDSEYPRDLARSGGWRSALSVPMLRDGEPIGAINVIRAEPQPFSDKQIALLQTFADQAVIAIENVRLFKELEARNGPERGARTADGHERHPARHLALAHGRAARSGHDRRARGAAVRRLRRGGVPASGRSASRRGARWARSGSRTSARPPADTRVG